MAEPDWNTCMAFVFAAEGGYVDDPLDPGGATNLGITLGELSQWRQTAVTKADVRDLGKLEAAEIYRTDYWNATRCSDLPAGIDLMVFDAAVNVGKGRSARFLQQAAGVTTDGSIGPETLAALAGVDAPALIARLGEARLAFCHELPRYDRFGGGWTARVQRAAALATQLAAPAPVPADLSAAWEQG